MHPRRALGGSYQTYGTVTDTLSGSAINGVTPSGEGTANESQLSGCGGFTLLTVQVKNVNLPDGTVLWVTFDGLAVGEITVSRGSGTMPLCADVGLTRPTTNHLHPVRLPWFGGHPKA